MKNKPKKLKISSQCQEDLAKIPQADREELMRGIIGGIQDGSFFADSEPVDMEKLKEEEPELYKRLQRSLKEINRKK